MLDFLKPSSKLRVTIWDLVLFLHLRVCGLTWLWVLHELSQQGSSSDVAAVVVVFRKSRRSYLVLFIISLLLIYLVRCHGQRTKLDLLTIR